jgi:hypothetical protein
MCLISSRLAIAIAVTLVTVIVWPRGAWRPRELSRPGKRNGSFGACRDA